MVFLFWWKINQLFLWAEEASWLRQFINNFMRLSKIPLLQNRGGSRNFLSWSLDYFLTRMAVLSRLVLKFWAIKSLVLSRICLAISWFVLSWKFRKIEILVLSWIWFFCLDPPKHLLTYWNIDFFSFIQCRIYLLTLIE